MRHGKLSLADDSRTYTLTNRINTMTAITSYLRHLIVTGVLVVIERTNLPVEGSHDAANAISLLAVGSLTWAIVKYAPQIAEFIGIKEQ